MKSTQIQTPPSSTQSITPTSQTPSNPPSKAEGLLPVEGAQAGAPRYSSIAEGPTSADKSNSSSLESSGASASRSTGRAARMISLEAAMAGVTGESQTTRSTGAASGTQSSPQVTSTPAPRSLFSRSMEVGEAPAPRMARIIPLNNPNESPQSLGAKVQKARNDALRSSSLSASESASPFPELPDHISLSEFEARSARKGSSGE